MANGGSDTCSDAPIGSKRRETLLGKARKRATWTGAPPTRGEHKADRSMKNQYPMSGVRKWMLLLMATIGTSVAQAQFLVDDFNRANNNTVGNGWTESETNPPGSVRITSNVLHMQSNIAGRDYVSMVTPSTYETTLNNNGCILEWSFNMRQNAPNPNGFFNLAHGIGFVLAGTSGDLMTGQGYAVVLGSSSNPDSLHLVRYSNGLSSNAVLTKLITVGPFNTQFLSVRVTFDPSTGNWEMFHASHPSSFQDPQTANTSAGTVINTTYTGTPLPYIGCMWNHGTVNSTWGQFDNIRVPYGCSSRVEFVGTSGSINSSAPSVSIPLQLFSPSLVQSTTVDITITSGDPAVIGGSYNHQVVFPASTTNADLVLSIPVDGDCYGDRQLVFQITGITGGTGTPLIGEDDTYTLTITDDRSGPYTALAESFETDGNGSRYVLNTAHANPGSGSFFLRGDNAQMVAAGGSSLTNSDGPNYIGASDLAAVAANSEVSVTFSNIEILGMSNVTVDLRAGARYSPIYDQAAAQRDYLFVEANVDGGGWTVVGAFRSHKLNPFVDGWLRQDTDLNGVGDGINLTTTFQAFQFPLNTTGSYMDVRVRVRSTAPQEEIYFDNVQVNGTRCRPIYWSQGSGLETASIWSTKPVGTPTAINVDRRKTLIIQQGHTVTSSGTDREVEQLTVENNAALDLTTSTWDIIGDTLVNEGSITSGAVGGIGIEGSGVVVMGGTGTYDVYDLSINAPGGTSTANTISVRGNLVLDGGVFDATAATVTLRSLSTGTGRLGPVPPGSGYLGSLTMERRIPAGPTNWRSLGSPVAGATIADWQDDFFTAGYPGSAYPNFYDPPGSGIYWPSIRWYDETDSGAGQNDGATGVTSTQPLSIGQGFTAWAGTTLNGTVAFTIDVTGAPNIAQTPITLPMTYTNTGVPSTDGWNLVSNPVPSPIDFALINRGADVSNAYWILNPQNGSMATWNGVVGTNGANGIIQSSQGFWLKANGSAVTTTVHENAKAATNSGGVFMQVADLPILRMNVRDEAQIYHDEALIVFADGIPGVDALDVPKLEFDRPGAPAISSYDVEGNSLTINTYGMPQQAISIPLKVRVTAAGQHQLQVMEIARIAGMACVRLEDQQEGISVELEEGSVYHFYMEPSSPTDRFIIHISTPVLHEVMDVTCQGLNDGGITVTVPDGAQTITLMDAFSTPIQQQDAVVGEFNALAGGDYLISVTSDAGCGDLVASIHVGEGSVIDAAFTTTASTCGNADGTLQAEAMGGVAPYTYTWNTGATGQQLIASAGEYSVTITDGNGCSWTSGLRAIDQEAGPTAAFMLPEDTYMPGEAVPFINLSLNADNYVWDMGDGTVTEAIEMNYIYGMPGEYTVSLTAISGACSDVFTQQVLIGGATSIHELETGAMAAWYNGRAIVVEHDLQVNGNARIELIDALGKVHAEQRITSSPGRSLMPAEELTDGVWFLRVTNGDQMITARVVVVR